MAPITETKQKAATFIRGRITSVDSRRHVVSFLGDNGKDYDDCQVASPFWHFSGHGFFGLPPVDARCLLQITGDDTSPLVSSFIDVPAPMTSSEQDESSGVTTEDGDEEDAKVGFSGAKPSLLPGDYGFLGLGGNFTFWRMSGVLQLGSSAFCQRVFNPVRNRINDYAESYSLSTVGGDLVLQSDREEDSDDATAGSRLFLCSHKKQDDEKASVLLGLGDLGSGTLFRLLISPNEVDRSKFSPLGTPVFSMGVDEDGNSVLIGKDCTETWSGSCTVSVSGSSNLSITGNHSVSAMNSSETIRGLKKITALGGIQLQGRVSFGGGTEPLVGNASALRIWLATHLHDPTTGLPVTPPPEIALLHLCG